MNYSGRDKTMKYYDEYQKFMRYKYGHHAFAIVLTLTILNMIISSAYDIQWAQTKEIESIVIIVLAVFYAIIMSIYRGAYFAKWENPIFYSIIFLSKIADSSPTSYEV